MYIKCLCTCDVCEMSVNVAKIFMLLEALLFRQHTEAANQAFENKNEDDLLYVLGKVKVTDKVTTDHIKLLIGRLSSRR